MTITLALARLADEGYVETAKSLGTFVSRQIPEQALHALQVDVERKHQPVVLDHFRPDLLKIRSHNLVNAELRRSMIDFWVGRPDARSFPLRTWARLTNQQFLSAGSALTEYKEPIGFIELRQAIADHLRPARGIVAEPEQIIITGGCQEALNLVCRMLLPPGTDAIMRNRPDTRALLICLSRSARTCIT